MDGNGRWAQQRGQLRSMGHRAGVKAVRRLVNAAAKAQIGTLTVYAFSQENWKRPATEVRLLMQLFVKTLAAQVDEMHERGICLRFIGDHSAFDPLLRKEMARAVALTANNTAMNFVIAIGYGGQQDIIRAAQKLVAKGEPLSEAALEKYLDTADLPFPDLMIRTGGEQRISNFLLWQLAYAELYFTETLWPDFDEKQFQVALNWYATRQRRFGAVLDADPEVPARRHGVLLQQAGAGGGRTGGSRAHFRDAQDSVSPPDSADDAD